jgi:hypothetical protein
MVKKAVAMVMMVSNNRREKFQSELLPMVCVIVSQTLATPTTTVTITTTVTAAATTRVTKRKTFYNQSYDIKYYEI